MTAATASAAIASFNADSGGVRTGFINAVAFAAGVLPSKVAIQNVVAHTASARRLLFARASLIQVTAFVHDAERLHRLETHLAAQNRKWGATLHHSHSWWEAHGLSVARAY